MQCKFSDKSCEFRFQKYKGKISGYFCKMAYWRLRQGICPYDKTIMAFNFQKNRYKKWVAKTHYNENQRTLGDIK